MKNIKLIFETLLKNKILQLIILLIAIIIILINQFLSDTEINPFVYFNF